MLGPKSSGPQRGVCISHRYARHVAPRRFYAVYWESYSKQRKKVNILKMLKARRAYYLDRCNRSVCWEPPLDDHILELYQILADECFAIISIIETADKTEKNDE